MPKRSYLYIDVVDLTCYPHSVQVVKIMSAQSVVSVSRVDKMLFAFATVVLAEQAAMRAPVFAAYGPFDHTLSRASLDLRPLCRLSTEPAIALLATTANFAVGDCS